MIGFILLTVGTVMVFNWLRRKRAAKRGTSDENPNQFQLLNDYDA